MGLLHRAAGRLWQLPGHPILGAIERNLDEVRALSPRIPGAVALGYHFCFGTLGGWPRFAPNDLGLAVKLANAFVAASGRRVNWIHLPVLDRNNDAFLAQLEPRSANTVGSSEAGRRPNPQ